MLIAGPFVVPEMCGIDLAAWRTSATAIACPRPLVEFIDVDAIEIQRMRCSTVSLDVTAPQPYCRDTKCSCWHMKFTNMNTPC
jgi:hypothetical protein